MKNVVSCQESIRKIVGKKEGITKILGKKRYEELESDLMDSKRTSNLWTNISLSLKGMSEAALPVMGKDVIPDLAKVENAIMRNDHEELSRELTAYTSLLYEKIFARS